MKIIISGSASCGKTSVINELATRGSKVFEDSARKVLTERKNHLPLRPEIEFRQNKILKLQKINEEEPSKELTFFDYGLIDILSYTQHLSKKKTKFPSDLSLKYGMVFLLDRIPWIKDDIRVESNNQEAEEIHKLIENNYKKFGYTPISVPALPVKERVDFILDKIRTSSFRKKIVA